MFSAEDLFTSCWPGVPFSEASPEDRKMFLSHAASLEMYSQSQET